MVRVEKPVVPAVVKTTTGILVPAETQKLCCHGHGPMQMTIEGAELVHRCLMCNTIMRGVQKPAIL